MKNLLLVIVLSTLCLGCVNSSQTNAQESIIGVELHEKENDQTNNSKSILDYITDLLLSSNLEVLQDWPKNSIYIYSENYEECNDFIYCFRVLSAPDPKETEVNSATVTTLCYNAKERRFYDTWSGSYTPLNLNYDKNIEINLLKKIRSTCPSFTDSEKKKSYDSINEGEIQLTNLPFNFRDYYELQLNVDMGEAENEEKYPKNNLEDNKSFEEKFINYFGIDTFPSSYYVFDSKKQFKTILMGCSIKNKNVIFYKIITTKNNEIIDQFTIYTDDTDKLKGNFIIQQDLHIIKYLSDNTEVEYKIEDDGKILKIK